MTDIIVAPFDDTRSDGPMLGGERELLDHWLELYRQSLLLKISGLTGEQLAQRSAPPSVLSLIGVVRHLAEVEAYWLREVLHGEDVPDMWSTRENPEGDITDASDATAAADVDAYRAEVELTRTRQAEWSDLDGAVVGRRHGQELNLRWILTHLIEEYARHLGHMDLLRERVDGATGY
ncbi:MAG: DinB family protein [Propionibacteriales bacterium]|nr:DinB family protein [Propionibacteriales bacterium]